MKKLKEIQASLFEIRAELENNDFIKKLVLNDSMKAISQETPGTNIKDSIIISPVFNISEEPYNKNTMITIYAQEIVQDEHDPMFETEILVNVITKNSLWHLENYSIRPLEISSQIIDLINNKKYAGSNKISFRNMSMHIIDKETNSYRLSFGLTDGSGKLNDQF